MLKSVLLVERVCSQHAVQMEFIVIVDRAGKVVTAAHNSALNGTDWNPANIVSDVLATGKFALQ
jgi:hypothetical protein